MKPLILGRRLVVPLVIALLFSVACSSSAHNLGSKSSSGTTATLAPGITAVLPAGTDLNRYQLATKPATPESTDALKNVSLNVLVAPLDFSALQPVPAGTQLRFQTHTGLSELVLEAFFDPSTKEWVPEPTTYDPNTGVAVATVAHFSVHGLYSWSAADAKNQAVVSGPACPDVMVIAARGSSEPPQTAPDASWFNQKAYVKDPNKGAGKVNFTLYGDLIGAAPQLRFSIDPVEYPADAVFPDLVTAVANYKASVNSGADTIIGDIERTERVCGDGVKYLFTGYSQGAWAVHKALHRLSESVLAKVVGVAFFGDPEFVPFQDIVRDSRVTDIYWGSSSVTDIPNTGVPKSIGQNTGSWCFLTDPVCQVTPTNSGFFAECVISSNLCPHFRYVEDGATTKAAQFLIPKLPTKSVWPRLTQADPPVGTVGSPYSWTATVAPTANASYTWATTGTLPPGLLFSHSGVLSGAPTQAGSYAFNVTATSKQGRNVTGKVTVTIKPPASQFARYAGSWGGHVRGLDIDASGRGEVVERTYNRCPGDSQYDPQDYKPGVPCDPIQARTVFQIDKVTSADGDTVHAIVVSTNDPSHWDKEISITWLHNAGPDVATIQIDPSKKFPDASTFCDDNAQMRGVCGA